MRLTPYENLKGFAHSKPPLMVFMACLGFFAVILMSLAYYVKLTERIGDPDIRQDWNEFLKRFSTVEFCIQNNVTDNNTLTKGSPPITTTPRPRLIDQRDVDMDLYDTTRNYSLFMQLSVIPTPEFIRIPHNVTHVTGYITGDMIGLMGDQAEEEISVTVELPYEWNNTKCKSVTGCEKINFFACVVFQASVDVFPRTTSPGTCESMNDTGIEYFTTMMPQKTNMYSSFYCRGKSIVRMRPDIDRTFTVYLSMTDRSVINLHLMHTSYFLFVMVVTILCYAVLRGRPQKTKITQTEALLGSHSSEA